MKLLSAQTRSCKTTSLLQRNKAGCFIFDQLLLTRLHENNHFIFSATRNTVNKTQLSQREITIICADRQDQTSALKLENMQVKLKPPETQGRGLQSVLLRSSSSSVYPVPLGCQTGWWSPCLESGTYRGLTLLSLPGKKGGD